MSYDSIPNDFTPEKPEFNNYKRIDDFDFQRKEAEEHGELSSRAAYQLNRRKPR